MTLTNETWSCSYALSIGGVAHLRYVARGVKAVSGPRTGLTVTLARGSAAVLEVELPELFRSFVTLTPAPP